MKILEITNVDFALRHFILPVMRAARDRGHEVVGACADGPLLSAVRAEGFRVETVPMVRRISPLAQWRAFRALVRLIRAEQPDMVHAHMPISGFLARLAARACGVPCIAYTCHGFLFNQPSPLTRRIVSWVMEAIAGRVTHVFLTVSTEESRDARRLLIHRHAIPVGNGRDPAVFRPDPEARRRIRQAFGTPADRPVVIVVSRLVRHKGHLELLEAMRSVPEAELWVVGERLSSDHGEDLEPAFQQAAAPDGLGPRLRRLGYREDIPALLAAADIFTLPSWFEGLPMSIVEAMLCGLPVVATSVRGPREQVVDGETGFLVPPRAAAPLAQALTRLATSPALCARMGMAGRQRALDHYVEQIVIGRSLDLLGL
ncbi:glycosyltransferase family 4 protein [Granulibacter bethesdensis]|uniref:glycosyltransferase family 4 protein n=1 Tax=Granulibacter bethesdensis TaxID=364410 RepID=UPI0003F21732|nr:glycosyltransferase family 4 protein [Granulibacter bethesdensis]AHJ65766.1 alpha-L-glycero-D-manno-heptose alpha-1,3-glucosyltransferase [Granulibacter bethesdensis CGDNIH4]